MKLLVLGGTSFVGRHLVLSARAAGIDVTLFNRGRTNPDLFSDVERIAGDRDGDLSGLAGRGWDAVLDVNGYVPRVVDETLTALDGRYDHYTFISTVSVYADSGAEGPDESSPVATLDEDTEEITGESYGPLKALCEDRVRSAAGDRALIVRPGLVVGPHDPTERFVRWIRRAADGNEVLAPGDPDRQITFIDGRDLADFTVRLLSRGASGTFNDIGPAQRCSMGDLLQTCVDTTGAGATLTWVPEQFLLDHDVVPWADLPLWVPAADNGLVAADNSRALEAGLTIRPLPDTVQATWRWDGDRTDRRVAGLPVEREREVLAAWHAHKENTGD
jgi:2'-hydroxyisoflavone reductase